MLRLKAKLLLNQKIDVFTPEPNSKMCDSVSGV